MKSQKAQKAAQFDKTKKLHSVISSYEETGLGTAAATAKGRALGQGKRQIWGGLYRVDQGALLSGSAAVAERPLLTPNIAALIDNPVIPSVEALRASKV